jgi:hypothetical protein
MRAWAFMLGGMIVWAAHFFALYIVASIFLTSTTSRVLTALITLACLAAAGLLLMRTTRALRRHQGGDAFTRWQAYLAALTASLALVAILWQGLPAFIA